ncbi:MAG: hypothetical protein P4K94_01030 [Terracidiphilus sp.]|jgi:hypothetical protein|nr:hypothetical protein [Terracidiphilus sp.]
MVVKTQCEMRGHTGLYVGPANVLRYFSKQLRAVELQLGDLHIGCELAPNFWLDRPEIHDPRLCSWLEFKVLRGNRHRTPVALALTPSGENSFRVEPFLLRTNSRDNMSLVELAQECSSMEVPQYPRKTPSRIAAPFPSLSDTSLLGDCLPALVRAAS